MISRDAVLAWTGIVVVGVAMLVWSWGTWPNAYVDFGRELYVPWRLSEGDVLYRDVAWFNGPLSPYRNALLFWLVGPGLLSLVIANAMDVVLIVGILYWLVSRVADRLAATAACLVFLVLFAFSQIDAIGNDNYLTPYSHEVTHGLVLSLLSLAAFAVLREKPVWRAVSSGFLLGLVALTKAELFLAAAGALVCGFAIEEVRRRRNKVDGLLSPSLLGAFVGALLLPGVVSFALLSLAMPAADAWIGTLGAWPALIAGDVPSQYFYRATLGFVGFGDNLERLLRWSAGWTCVFGAIAVVALRVRPSEGGAKASADLMTFGGAFALALVVVVFAGGAFSASWPEFMRPLPLIVGVLAVGSAVKALRGASERGAESSDPVLRTALLVFATLLLAKIVFRVRLDQYGFALAMPAAMLTTAATVCWLPRWIGTRGGDAQLARAASLGVVAAVVIALLPTIAFRFAERSHPIARGRDTFLVEEAMAFPMQDVLRALAARPQRETLAVLPEGVMINYLLRRVNPTGHVNFMPPELLIFGEDRILEAFEASPPDWIALTHKDTREYGVGFFGRGYGRNLYGWVLENYEPVALFGDPPGEPDSHFGIHLLKHRNCCDGLDGR